jgi:cytochrome c-type biogenesis protein
VVGLAFAFGWTPCVGPVLAAILIVAGVEGSAARGAALLGAYSLGIGLPFLLASLFSGQFIRLMARMRNHMNLVEKLMGGSLVLTGILFLTGAMPKIAGWLLETFPAFSSIG